MMIKVVLGKISEGVTSVTQSNRDSFTDQATDQFADTVAAHGSRTVATMDPALQSYRSD